MKIIIALFGCLESPYKELIQGAKETWASVPHPDVTTIFFYGGQETYRKDNGNDVWDYGFECSDAYDMQHRKFKMLLDVIPSVDFVISTSTAQYIDKRMLVEKVQTLPSTRCYYGQNNYLAWPGGGCPWEPYVSGAGRIMSPDVIDVIKKGLEDYPSVFPYEDVLIGRILGRHGVPIFDDGRTVFNFRTLKDPFNDPFPRHFNYRCKVNDEDRSSDIKLFRRIFERCK